MASPLAVEVVRFFVPRSAASFRGNHEVMETFAFAGYVNYSPCAAAGGAGGAGEGAVRDLVERKRRRAGQVEGQGLPGNIGPERSSAT